MAAHTPHKQLKLIRRHLGITQQRAAEMLGVSYSYFLSVETGQRELSKPLGAKIAKTFGVAHIAAKDDEPMIEVDGELVPFSRATYERRATRRPSFHLEQYAKVMTPNLRDYARCAHALLHAAEKQKHLPATVADFLEWTNSALNSGNMFDEFRRSFEKLFPKQRPKSDAFSVVEAYSGWAAEKAIEKEDTRRAARNARQRRIARK